MLEAQKKKLRLIAQAAVAAEKATACPAELQAAQCILESGWLDHAPGNNCFGIKSFSGENGRQLLATREWFTGEELARFLALGDGRTARIAQPGRHDARGRRLYHVRDWFASFATLADCFARRAAGFTAGRYAPFAAAYQADHNLEALVRGIAPIYATDPSYADKVLGFVHDPDIQEAISRARREAAA
jgi:flagellum-specific peptidoglycan hydrolase FlgJ